MPAFAFNRQPVALAWFDTAAGEPLLTAEQAAIGAALSGPTPQPWLWLAPETAAGPALPPASVRGLRLHCAGGGFSGPLRCGLPLPLHGESFDRIIVQHAHEYGGDQLLEECERLLAPGGRLWLFSLNPLSPYRWRWRKAGLTFRDALSWRLRLQALGLQVATPASHLGPLWRIGHERAGNLPSGLRAVCLLQAEKRAAAMIPPSPAGRRWRPGAATA
ncbi:hypothetical protein [Pseudoxanthomonas wuyuanensis]